MRRYIIRYKNVSVFVVKRYLSATEFTGSVEQELMIALTRGILYGFRGKQVQKSYLLALTTYLYERREDHRT